MNIRDILKFNAPYYSINREERNLAAIFYHALLIKDNLKIFIKELGIEYPLVEDEMGIYFEYSFLRDLWFSIDKSNNLIKRDIILNLLKPENTIYLQNCSIEKFNTYFGAVPTASRDYIQSPGNWSIDRYNSHISDKNEFLKICKFKWCFNAKPDIVIHTSNNHAICIEGKYESGEGEYPSKKSEKMIFKNRGLTFVKQTEIQGKIMDLLGIKSSFVFLVQKNMVSTSHKTLYWEEAFNFLDLNESPRFIQNWIKSIKRPYVNKVIPNPSPKRTVKPKYFANKIAPKYSQNLLKLKNSFPAGYNFLKYPEVNNTCMWLSTSVNAHLYYSEYFLAYIKIEGNTLVLSPGFNNIITEYTRDGSGKLFNGQIQALIKLCHGIEEDWASQRGELIILKATTPDKFFKKLISYIEGI
ncbi:MAG: hypothetical protein K0B11_01955 [Mariniphaga sp.]|nr:hypothetical protein [Mariniphaga sp.]